MHAFSMQQHSPEIDAQSATANHGLIPLQMFASYGTAVEDLLSVKAF
jgi:hypothetical protein